MKSSKVTSNLEPLRADLLRLKMYKDELAQLTTVYDTAHKELQKAMAKAKVRTVSVVHGPDVITGTYTQGSRMVIGEARLKKEIGALKFNKITKRVLDKEKLEAALVTGYVDANVVAACTEEIPNAPYIRMTVKANQIVRTRKKAAK